MYVTGPEKTCLIYTKYTCSYYGTYILFFINHAKSVSFIEFLMDFCIYIDILDTILNAEKSYILHFKLLILGHILHVDKTGFLKPGHIYITCSYVFFFHYAINIIHDPRQNRFLAILCGGNLSYLCISICYIGYHNVIKNP